MRGGVPRSDAELGAAFEADGYAVERIERYHGCRGILARSVLDPNRTALYVEGPARERGYLIGYLACERVERMASEFVDNVVPAFVAPALFHPLRFRRLKARLMDILRHRCLKTYYRHPDDIPECLKDELRGTVAGCRARNPATRVTYRELFLLNTGIDFLLSYVYTGVHLLDWVPDLDAFLAKLRGRSRLVRRLAAAIRVPRVRARHLRVPLACNAFFLGRSLTDDGGCYFGRDFMFATAAVFQDTCCLIVHNPLEDAGEGGDRRDVGNDRQHASGALPIVSLTAPGLVGSITAMNVRGVAVGVDMLPAENCNFRRPGLNSLLLARRCADSARSLEDAVDTIVEAQRGVSWLYVVADGRSGRAAAVEAGMTTEALDGLSYVPQRCRSVLEKHPYRPGHPRRHGAHERLPAALRSRGPQREALRHVRKAAQRGPGGGRGPLPHPRARALEAEGGPALLLLPAAARAGPRPPRGGQPGADSGDEALLHGAVGLAGRGRARGRPAVALRRAHAPDPVGARPARAAPQDRPRARPRRSSTSCRRCGSFRRTTGTTP